MSTFNFRNEDGDEVSLSVNQFHVPETVTHVYISRKSPAEPDDSFDEFWLTNIEAGALQRLLTEALAPS